MTGQYVQVVCYQLKQDYLFRCSVAFVAPENLTTGHAGTNQKVVFYYISNQIFRKRFENGKQPSIWISVIGNVRKKLLSMLILKSQSPAGFGSGLLVLV